MTQATEQKRVLPEDLIACYDKAGVSPAQNIYVSESNCHACAFGAVFLAENDINLKETLDPEKRYGFGTQAVAHGQQTYGMKYFDGFIWGFDARPQETMTDEKELRVSDEEKIQGYKDGKAGWSAVKHLAGYEDFNTTLIAKEDVGWPTHRTVNVKLFKDQVYMVYEKRSLESGVEVYVRWRHNLNEVDEDSSSGWKYGWVSEEYFHPEGHVVFPVIGD